MTKTEKNVFSKMFKNISVFYSAWVGKVNCRDLSPHLLMKVNNSANTIYRHLWAQLCEQGVITGKIKQIRSHTHTQVYCDKSVYCGEEISKNSIFSIEPILRYPPPSTFQMQIWLPLKADILGVLSILSIKYYQYRHPPPPPPCGGGRSNIFRPGTNHAHCRKKITEN